MKKNFIYATLSAIALVGAVSLSACSTSEDVEDVNPTFDGETVKTQFTISLPQNLNKTRQTYGIVQEAQTITSFRGMSNIVLIPFSNAESRTTRLGGNITLGANKMIDLSSTTTPKAYTTNSANSIPSGSLLSGTDNNNAVLYNDVTIPIGTAGFLFYGEATASTNGTGFTDGSLTATGLDGETSAISFTPTPVLGWSDATNFTPNDPNMTKGNAIATYVSSIAAASYDDGTDATTDDVQYIWAKCANSANSNETWYNAGLGEMYTAFTSMKAGASSYVQAAVQDLYTSILNNTDKVSIAIRSAITDATYVSSTTDGKLTFTADITGYPADNNMPEGAAALSWAAMSETPSLDEPKVASAVGGSNFGHLEGGMNVVNMTNIVYPASLYYYVDSPIKTSNTSRVNDYDGTKPWNQDGDNNDILDTYTNGAAVSSATRSVAITKPVQYAVGRLDVKVNPLTETTYYDRKGEEVSKTYVPNSSSPETTAPAFELTGVLIGGQKAVGYQFTPTGSTEYTIYDNVINTENSVSAVVPTVADTYAGPTYTLALETAANTSIYVALEFVNKGNDFQGYDGVVKHGCKFYMIAKLDPSNNVDKQVSGVANTGNKVFKQDFKTIANFKFGAGTADTNGNGASDTPGGFANAYTTIPDLRTPQLELGLSVDLTWQNGITFDVTF